jgi:hypothetical protein
MLVHKSVSAGDAGSAKRKNVGGVAELLAAGKLTELETVHVSTVPDAG